METKKTTLCIVGNRGHLNVALDDIKISTDCEIVGVGGAGPDISATSVATSCAQALGSTPPVFDGDYRAMLDAAKPDVLVVCGPFEDHAAMTVEAVSRSIHVFCEKSISSTLEGLADIARIHRLHPEIQIAQMCGPHYQSGLWDATQRITEIGGVRLLNAQKSYKLGRREAFFMNRATSAGLIPWVGIHAISWLYHFAGRIPFKTVCATQSSACNHNHGDLEMTAACLFTFDDGISATATADYLRPGNGAIDHGDDRIRVMGTGGALEVIANTCHVITPEGSTASSETPPIGMFADFIRKVNCLPANMMTGIDLLRVTQAALLARESADKANYLNIPEI